ncbi:MAG: hypothetical protein RLY31_573 [Bacteroidota bacterium]
MEADKDIMISLQNVSKYYRLYSRKSDRIREAFHPTGKKFHEKYYALRNINLQVGSGEILGVMGRNGCGKSTLMKVISNILTPNEGSVRVSGHIVPLLELGAGFNPEFTGLENIYFYNYIHGFSHSQTDAMLNDILEFAEIGQYIHQPLKSYSSGMRSRLAFAVSINIDPDILILDEVLAVGDERFRRKCYAVMETFFKGGKTVLFVSHSKSAIFSYCTRAILMHEGEIILDGPAKLVSTLYTQHVQAAVELLPETLATIRRIEADVALKEAIYQEISELNKPENDLDDLGPELPTEAASLVRRMRDNQYRDTEEEVDTMLENQPNFLLPKAMFLENLSPASSYVTEHPDFSISDVRITTPSGETVNQLITGDTYELEFRLRIRKDQQEMYWYVAVKLPNGFQIFEYGPKGKARQRVISDVAAGFDRTVRWQFACNLLRGSYFVDIGIRQPNFKKTVDLYKISDALLFKVRTPPTFAEKGISFLNMVPLATTEEPTD